MTRTDPVPILRRLIRFDTTNPPGGERPCVDWIDALLSDAGFATRRLARDPERPNLVTRLPGAGEAPPFLLYGHVDVVTVEGQEWSHPPFGGVLEDGWVWGRGALDMKGGVAMMLSALLTARAEGLRPAGDVILAILSDEEAGGTHGAAFLAERHPEVFEGVRWAVGEFGGFPIYLGGRRYCPVQVAEKGVCWLEATIRGRGGHGSVPRPGGTPARLGRFLTDLGSGALPHRVVDAVRSMITTMAEAADPPLRRTLLGLLDGETERDALDRLGDARVFFEAVLRNTASATVVRAGSKTNVVPSAASVEIDGRTLPGQTRDDLVRELEDVVGGDVVFRTLRRDAGTDDPDLRLYPLLARLLRERDPGCVPTPLVLMGGTDARHLARLGIQTYGCLPVDLPEGFSFMDTVHGPDERVPAASLRSGRDFLVDLLDAYTEPA